MNDKPAPHITAETAPFWAACNEHKFSYQRCATCGGIQFYPRSVCANCRSTELSLVASRGQGKVATFTIVHRAPLAAFKDDTPYVLALVDFDEGFRAMMNVVDCDAADVTIGTRVHLVFEDRFGQLIPQAALLPER